MYKGKQTEIYTYFQDIKRIKWFMLYCEKIGIEKISELNHDVIEYTKILKNIGTSTHKQIAERFEEIVKDENNKNIIDISSNLFKYSSEENYNIKLSEIYQLNKYKNIINQLAAEQIITIEDLKSQTAQKIIDIIGPIEFSDFRYGLPPLKEDYMKTVITDCIKDNKDIGFHIVSDRSKGISFEEIGTRNNLTYESIKKIEVIYLDKIINKVETIIAIIMTREQTEFFKAEKISGYIENKEFAQMWKYILKKSKKYIYVDFADIFVKMNGKNEDIIHSLKTIVLDVIGEVGNLKDVMDGIYNGLTGSGIRYFDIDDIKIYLELNGYDIYGDYVIKKGKSYGLLCKEIVKKHFQDGIDISSDDDIRFLMKQLNWDERKPNNKAKVLD